MKFVVFSGTTEGRLLSCYLADAGAEVRTCVASDYGREQQGEEQGVAVIKGPLSPEEKAGLLQGAALCVDATHPYATHVSVSVREACAAVGIPYVRLLREESGHPSALTVSSAEEASALLAQQEGNILLTTGAKELPAFSGIAPERIFPRILPTHEGISACERAAIPHRNIIAMQGPFSRELNEAILRQYAIRYLVTKDGGSPGGFPEKAEAAEAVGVKLIVIRRPRETGLRYRQVLMLCDRLLHGHQLNPD